MLIIVGLYPIIIMHSVMYENAEGKREVQRDVFFFSVQKSKKFRVSPALKQNEAGAQGGIT